MTPTDVAEKILAINKDLEEFIQLLEEKCPPEKPTHLHANIEITLFDGSWQGRFMPSLLNLPFGTVILQKGVSGDSLDVLLSKMKQDVERQLKNLKEDKVDTLRL